MNNWTTIKTVTHPSEIAVIRGRLEAEGIECFVLNELTTQVNPFYSNAVGGVQLQVKDSDLPNAIAILNDGSYYSDREAEPPKILLHIDSSTSKIPLLRKLPLLYRLIILIAVIVGVMISVFVYATLPSIYERLTANSWCLNYVIYDNKYFKPQTNDYLKLIGAGICEESITFRHNGDVTLPGFKSHTIWGSWKLVNSQLYISQTDTFDFVYNGIYQLEFANEELILRSEKTTLNCHAENIHVNLPF
jgi:hypothetical protein